MNGDLLKMDDMQSVYIPELLLYFIFKEYGHASFLYHWSLLNPRLDKVYVCMCMYGNPDYGNYNLVS